MTAAHDHSLWIGVTYSTSRREEPSTPDARAASERVEEPSNDETRAGFARRNRDRR